MGGCPEPRADAHPYPSMPCALFLAGCVPVPALGSASCAVLPRVWCYAIYLPTASSCAIASTLQVSPWYWSDSRMDTDSAPDAPYRRRIASTFHHLPHTGIYTPCTRRVPGACTNPPSHQQPPASRSIIYNWGPIPRA